MNMHSLALSSRVAAHVLLISACLSATDFHVDGIRGADVPAGGTQAQPWKSVGYALTRVLPPATGRHRILISGNQRYALTSTLTLASAVELVGVGPVKPTFVAPANGVSLVANQSAAGDFVLRSLNLTGGITALEVDPTPLFVGDMRIEVDNCDFSGQSGTSVSLNVQGCATSSLLVSRCKFASATKAIDVVADERPVFMQVSRCDFVSAPVEFNVRSAPPFQSLVALNLDVTDCLFRGCSGPALLVGGANSIATSLSLSAKRCAFRSNRIGIATSLGMSGRAVVDQSSFIDHEVALRFTATGQDRTDVRTSFEATRNVIRNARSAGIAFVFIGRLPSLGAFTRSNLIEACDVGIDVQIGDKVTGTFASNGDIVRGSARMAMSVVGLSFACPVTISNSILAQSARVGLRAGGTSPTFAQFVTIADCGGHALDLGSQPVTLDHCVLDNPFQPEVYGGARLSARYTCSRTTTFAGTGNLVANPMLQRPFYKLDAASPCIDAGDSLATGATDYEGDPRKVGARVDLGADEVRLGSIWRFGAAMPTTNSGFRIEMRQPQVLAQIGNPLRIEMSGGIGDANQAALGAILMVGFADGAPVLDVDAVLPGGQLYFTPLAISSVMPVDASGSSSDQVQIPMLNALVGTTFAAQWLCLTPGSSPFGATLSDGLRVTIGR